MIAFIRSGRRTRRTAKIAGGIALAVVVAVGGYLGALQITGNFHPVVAGQLYRSAQPGPADIARYQKDYGIKTIVNLRGENTGSPWYDAEIAEAGKLSIAHINFRMSARRELTSRRAPCWR